MGSPYFHFDVPSIALGLLAAAVVQLFAAMLIGVAPVAIVGLICGLLSAGVFTLDHHITRETTRSKETDR